MNDNDLEKDLIEKLDRFNLWLEKIFLKLNCILMWTVAILLFLFIIIALVKKGI